jgi:hypothetical protein
MEKIDLESLTQRYATLIDGVAKENSSYDDKLKNFLEKKPWDEASIKEFLKSQAAVLGNYIGYFTDLTQDATSKKLELEGKIYNAKLDIAVAEGVFPTELMQSTTVFMQGQLLFYNTIIEGSGEVVRKIKSTIEEITALVSSDNFSETLKIISYMRQEANG